MAEELPFVDYQLPKPGHSGPLIALVGEAPGADEVKQGKPFVGRAGQLLDKALAAAEIDRDACLVANVFRLRPPDNKVAHFFASRRRAAAEGETLAEEPGKLGGAFCRIRYAGEIAALGAALNRYRPAIVVALGRTPLWALTGMDGITALRGKILKGRLSPAPVIATFHPSFVMRQNSIGPQTEATFRADLELAKDLAARSHAGHPLSAASAAPSGSLEIGAPG